MSDSTAIVLTAECTEPPADGAGRRCSSAGSAVLLFTGLQGVEFEEGWMARAIGAPTAGGRSFEYFVVGEELRNVKVRQMCFQSIGGITLRC